MENTIKVVLICSVSNEDIRNHLHFPKLYWGNIWRKILKKNLQEDYAIWNTNAINILKRYPELEVHVISPHQGLSNLVEYTEDGINYHFFWEDYDYLKEKIKTLLHCASLNAYKKFRKDICDIVRKINPDIVHVIGAENRFYSLATLDLPKRIPTIVQLQTLISDARFENNCTMGSYYYAIMSRAEKEVINQAKYIGTSSSVFINIIKETIKKDAQFVKTTLPVTEPVNIEDNKKEFDFVYFAADIQKAGDIALNAFILAQKQEPSLTLDIIGGYTPEFKRQLDNTIIEAGVHDNIKFEGRLETHDDVLVQIRKSRFALLPLRVDLVSGTIREAMANGLPVVTTITPDTIKFNRIKESILVSELEDLSSMAQNMLKLYRNRDYSQMITQNAAEIAAARESNDCIVNNWVKCYKQILS